MFCFMELDLISLKVSAVSSSRFWVVYGFSLSWEVLVLAVFSVGNPACLDSGDVCLKTLTQQAALSQDAPHSLCSAHFSGCAQLKPPTSGQGHGLRGPSSNVQG